MFRSTVCVAPKAANHYNSGMKKGLLIVAACMLLLSACAPAMKTSESYALDTICTQKVRGENADVAIGEVNAMLQRITREYSLNEGSQLFAVNIAAPDAAQVSEEAAALIAQALQIAEETGGAFDPTIGPVTVLWNISGNPRLPSDEQISTALPLVDYSRVRMEGVAITLPEAGMMLDLGGIAKGYAADLAVTIYEKHGIGAALLNLGGNVYAYGAREDGSDWKIGLRDPLGNPGEYAAVIPIKNGSVVTSGVYERFFEKDGQVYHHLFDPRTGYPSDNGLLAVTVVCENSARADALSTALFVMGLEEGLEAAQNMPDVQAVFFTEARQIYVTDGLKESIEITNEAYTLKS